MLTTRSIAHIKNINSNQSKYSSIRITIKIMITNYRLINYPKESNDYMFINIINDLLLLLPDYFQRLMIA